MRTTVPQYVKRPLDQEAVNSDAQSNDGRMGGYETVSGSRLTRCDRPSLPHRAAPQFSVGDAVPRAGLPQTRMFGSMSGNKPKQNPTEATRREAQPLATGSLRPLRLFSTSQKRIATVCFHQRHSKTRHFGLQHFEDRNGCSSLMSRGCWGTTIGIYTAGSLVRLPAAFSAASPTSGLSL
jgi:hypothetical protein